MELIDITDCEPAQKSLNISAYAYQHFNPLKPDICVNNVYRSSLYRKHIVSPLQRPIVTHLINTLPGKSSVNTIRACNSRASCVFHVSGCWHRIGDVTHQQYVAVT
jgi:hypothetical protein